MIPIKRRLVNIVNAQGKSLGEQCQEQIQKEERLLLIDEVVEEEEATNGISNVTIDEVKKTIES